MAIDSITTKPLPSVARVGDEVEPALVAAILTTMVFPALAAPTEIALTPQGSSRVLPHSWSITLSHFLCFLTLRLVNLPFTLF